MTIDVYQQYFAGNCVINGRPRHAADVRLTSDSEQGMIRYEISVNFFPHDDEEDFAVSYDGYVAETVYAGKGRRSRKREAAMLAEMRETADRLAASVNGTIDWENPLRGAVMG